MKFIERLLSMLAWLQIFISPTIIGTVSGGLIWLAMRDAWGIGLGTIVAAAGAAAGIAFAEKARRGKGPIESTSRNIAYPALREKELADDFKRIKYPSKNSLG